MSDFIFSNRVNLELAISSSFSLSEFFERDQPFRRFVAHLLEQLQELQNVVDVKPFSSLLRSGSENVISCGAAGIGLEIVRHLTAEGMCVVAVDRDSNACARAQRSLAMGEDRVRNRY